MKTIIEQSSALSTIDAPLLEMKLRHLEVRCQNAEFKLRHRIWGELVSVGAAGTKEQIDAIIDRLPKDVLYEALAALS